MTRKADRPQDVAEEVFMAIHERGHQIDPALSVCSQDLPHVAETAGQHRRRPIVKRMRQRRWRRQPPHAVIGQAEVREDRRHDAHRVDGGANIMQMPRECQTLGPTSAANGFLRFENFDRQASAGENHGRRQAVRTRADDHRIARRRCHAELNCMPWAAIEATSRTTQMAKSVLPITGRRVPWTLPAEPEGVNKFPCVLA